MTRRKQPSTIRESPKFTDYLPHSLREMLTPEQLVDLDRVSVERPASSNQDTQLQDDEEEDDFSRLEREEAELDPDADEPEDVAVSQRTTAFRGQRANDGAEDEEENVEEFDRQPFYKASPFYYIEGNVPSKTFRAPLPSKSTVASRREDFANSLSSHGRLVPARSSPCPASTGNPSLSRQSSAAASIHLSHPSRSSSLRLAHGSDGQLDGMEDDDVDLAVHVPQVSKTKRKRRSRSRESSPSEDCDASDRGRSKIKKKSVSKRHRRDKSNDRLSSNGEDELSEDSDSGAKKYSKKSKKRRSKGSKEDKADNGRMRRKHFDNDTRQAIDIASVDLNAFVMTNVPMLNEDTFLDEASKAWDRACKQLGKKIKLTSGVLDCLTDSITSLRSRIKSFVRSHITAEFGFGTKTQDRVTNKNLAIKLLEDSNFIFRNHQPQHDKPSGIFRNLLIELAIKEVFFKNKKDIGVKYANYFNPMPLETVALVATIMHFCIAQYNTETGARSTTHFIVEDNRSLYEGYLESLKTWRRAADQLQVVSAYQMSLYQAGREHSNTTDAVAQPQISIPSRFFTEVFVDNTGNDV